ncbi:hypothetical protein Poly30_21280 [Planctomycetes bacterium Poly30]|uniref:Alginate export domain-containing protein n=1 Tax=Saltatorellus ferox TaxID=2528018 RepID=A0A518ER96_9BACT|nr:hypothetical protein Poly30_21280 [Planctomycetes bacterium Poly30]
MPIPPACPLILLAANALMTPAAGSAANVWQQSDPDTLRIREAPDISDVFPAPAEDAHAAEVAATDREATGPETLLEAVIHGRSWVDFRYRYEGADYLVFPRRSWASTLRTAVGHETQSFHGFRALGEIEAIAPILNPSYNDTVNGNVDRAPIPDPEGLEIHQLYVAYDGHEDLDARLGRQEIALGNQRFVGIDPWRQNHQSFDALRLSYQVDETLTLDYSFAFGVNRVVGNDSPFGREDMAGHFLDVRKTQKGVGNFAGYAYLTDYDELDLLSTNTFGGRFDRVIQGDELGGKDAFWNRADWGVALEYAHQTDAGDNPTDISADYLLIEGSADFSGFRLTLASETLGGSGDPNDSFSTPLASLHWFNGYADQFQGTPDAGLVDRRLGFDTDVRLSRLPFPLHLEVTYHWFDSDAGSTTYGRELDLDVQAVITDQFSAGMRYADFNGQGGFEYANRFMAWISYRLL